MNGRGKSDRSIVPAKPSNQGDVAATSAAEGVEGRGRSKGNAGEPTRFRAQIRSDLPQALDRVRQAAQRDRQQQFTTLWHHVYNPDRLREAYLGLKRHAAPGVDRVTWHSYRDDLEAQLTALSSRLKRGAYRAQPVKAQLRHRLHDPIDEVGAYMRSVVNGHCRYYGVPRNGPALNSFRHAALWLWWRSLQRRTQRHRSHRKLLRRFKVWVTHFIPPTHILQPYPEQRLRVMTQGRSPVR